jgi:hypothetical protein
MCGFLTTSDLEKEAAEEKERQEKAIREGGRNADGEGENSGGGSGSAKKKRKVKGSGNGGLGLGEE